MKQQFSYKHFIHFLRKQPKHMQHVYAFVFAGGITALIAGIILYTDYGFWHDRYVRDDSALTVQESAPEKMESPSQALSHFWSDAANQFHAIGSGGSALLVGKETYVKEDIEASSTLQSDSQNTQ